MLKSGRSRKHSVKGCSFDGCSCHNTKAQRRAGKRPAKRREERAWRAQEGA
jgi:hypothetical protein